MGLSSWLRTGRRIRPWMVAVALATGGAGACRSSDRVAGDGPGSETVTGAAPDRDAAVPDSAAAGTRCAGDEDCARRFGVQWFCGTSDVHLEDDAGGEVPWSRICACCRPDGSAEAATDAAARSTGSETDAESRADGILDEVPILVPSGDDADAEDDGVDDAGGDFGVRDAIRRTRVPTVDLADDVTLYGAISPTVVRRLLQPARNRIGTCYETALERDPTLAGRVVAIIEVDAEHDVHVRAETENPALEAAGIVACVTREIGRLRLDTYLPSGTTLRYPFVFTPPE